VPDEADKFSVAVPLEADGSSIAADLGSAGSYALLALDPDKRALEGTSVLENPTPAGDPGRAIKLAVALARHGADRLLVRGDAPSGGAYYVMEANGMDIVSKPDLKTLGQAEDALESLLENRH